MGKSSETTQELHAIKGVVTKFMRMLFPLEFRIDSIANTAPMLPFQYPLVPGEMICLPEKVEPLGKSGGAYNYYFVTTAHLAARHDFGTFKLKLADLPGFEERAETGVEAIDSFIASFEDPALAGALMRLGEAARIDAELARRYRGLAPRITQVNEALLDLMPPDALSTMLLRGALDLLGDDDLVPSFARAAGSFFEPLREGGANVLTTARQTIALYQWIEDLIARAREAGEGDPLSGDADRMRNDLISSRMKAAEGADDSMGEDGEQGGGGEPDQKLSMETSGQRNKGSKGRALSPEELRKLIEQGAEIRPSQGDGNVDGDGMYLTQLTGKQMSELEQMREQLAEAGTVTGQGRLMLARNRQDSYYAYDEWDYVLGDYRRSWCRLREIPLSGDEGDFYNSTLVRYSELLPIIRRNFQRIRPASYRMVRGLEDGEEIDFDRSVEAHVSRRMGEIPDPRVYKARKKEARDVATLFLLDMSASTDEPIHREPRKYSSDDDPDDWMKAWQRRPQSAQRPRRIIDVNKEALVIMAQSLEELGDQYAIMGFSGHGRDNVEFYVIKEFDQELSDEVRARVGAVEPKRSTRMGAAIRHVREKFKDVTSRAKHVILLSDGFPQDFDYGHDRRSNAYGIQDTMVALKELEMAGVLPFCITVDKTGHDYLRQMCQSSRYLVIEDITSLPRQLPKVYEQVVRW